MKKGFTNFGFHTYSKDAAKITQQLSEEKSGVRSFALTEESGGLEALDPETAARQHLDLMLSSSGLPQIAAPAIKEKPCEFRTIGVETLPLTGTKTVKFRQTYDRIPVYGSLITIELDEKNDLLAVNSSIGMPENVDGVADIPARDAIETARRDAGLDEPLNSAPQLAYYMDTEGGQWHLAYLIEDVPQYHDSDDVEFPPSLSMDYWIDANSGEIIVKLPSSANIVNQNVIDGLGNPREIRCVDNGNGLHLHDELLNVHTYDFSFQDIVGDSRALPGTYIANPPDPWNNAAVSAHANGAAVAEFLRNVLRRNSVDNRGGKLISSVNCIDRRQSPDGRQWQNAAWYGGQMVYGQRRVGGRLRSYAVGLDVVAHEIFHGVTQKTADLVYAGQSGALNESYSDIFGIIVSNAGENDFSRWNWEMGEDLNTSGIALRDLSRPRRFNQPDHMDKYRNRPLTQEGDWGGVHANSGIHNHAAFKIMTAKDAAGANLFTPDSAAALFYTALTQFLTRNSEFSDSRRAIVTVAQTLFRDDPVNLRDMKLAAIAEGFDDVGIS